MRFLSEINSPADLRQLKCRRFAGSRRRSAPVYHRNLFARRRTHGRVSLGAVELAVAMHYVFDTPNDSLVWDVGHQAYAHKILTGRRDELHTIKTIRRAFRISAPRRIGIRHFRRGTRFDFAFRRARNGGRAR